MRVLLLGFGHVGRRLAEILVDRAAFPGLADLEVTVVGITTGSHGALADPAGIDLREALAVWREHGGFASGHPAAASAAALASLDAARGLDYDVLVELTPLDLPGRGRDAIAHVRAALERGRHAVSANKGPLAWACRELYDLARERRVAFLHESAVLDGAPVFNLARHCLRGNGIRRIEGILNSTTNFVLGELERGSSLAHAVARAQAMGVAEADPSHDLDGWDAAVKIAALANVLLGARLTPEEVARESLREIDPERIRTARDRGHRIKLVCEIERKGEGEGKVAGRVRARELPLTDPFALVQGTGSILRLSADLVGTIVLTEENPDLTTTAYGVLSDLLSLPGAG